MPRPIVLIGGGGHALSVVEAIGHDRHIIGYVDLAESEAMAIPYLGNDEAFLASGVASEAELLVTMVAGRACSLELRRSILQRYSGFKFARAVASTAYLGSNSEIGDGTVVMHNAFINTATKIGCHCVVNTAAIVEHGCTLGNNVFVGPGAVICGGVETGDNVYIGANTSIRPGVKICSDVVTGIGSVVINDITEPGTYAGVPIKRLKK